MAMKYMNDVKVIVEPNKIYPGMWYWALKIDGETYADGETSSEDEAHEKVIFKLAEWKRGF